MEDDPSSVFITAPLSETGLPGPIGNLSHAWLPKIQLLVSFCACAGMALIDRSRDRRSTLLEKWIMEAGLIRGALGVARPETFVIGSPRLGQDKYNEISQWPMPMRQ